MATDPLVKVIEVPVEPEAAFRRFTDELDAWWPRRTHSVFQESCASVRMEGEVGGRLYEVSDEGEESDWGRLTAWDPPRRLAFTWHPGRDAETAQHVEVTFRSVDDGTELRVEHGGWEVLGEKAEETKGRYDQGWDKVLGDYRSTYEGS